MFVTNWNSTTKIQKISEITNFFRHYFLSRTEVIDLNNKLLMMNIHTSFKQAFLLFFIALPICFVGCTKKASNKAQMAQKEETVALGKVNVLTASDFKKKIMDYESHPDEWVFAGSRPAIIDFYTTWCGPCKMMAPMVESLAGKYAGKIDFYKVDIDQEPELASVFGIRSIPTFLFIPLKGNPTMQMGAMQKEDFEEIIGKMMGK